MPRLESGSGTKSDQIDNLQPFANHLLKIFGYLWLISKLLQGNFSARVVLKKPFFFLFKKKTIARFQKLPWCSQRSSSYCYTFSSFRHGIISFLHLYTSISWTSENSVRALNSSNISFLGSEVPGLVRLVFFLSDCFRFLLASPPFFSDCLLLLSIFCEKLI